jgi:DNA-binding transcriptional regulator YhcF (GntR family)
MSQSDSTQNETDLRTNERKWTKPLMDAGWTAMPTVIIENQQQLGIDSIDLNIILFLASKWWTADGKPFPAKATMAKTMGVDPRTIQRRIARLERDGLIRREQRRSELGSRTNVYHLEGLIEAAKPFALEKLSQRNESQKAERTRLNRRGPPKVRQQQTSEA